MTSSGDLKPADWKRECIHHDTMLCISQITGNTSFLTQVALARVFKALTANQQLLGLKIGDIKSSISLTPLPLEELQHTVQRAVFRTIQASNWHRFDGNTAVYTNILHAAPGTTVVAPVVKFELQASPPASVYCKILYTGK